MGGGLLQEYSTVIEVRRKRFCKFVKQKNKYDHMCVSKYSDQFDFLSPVLLEICFCLLTY